MCPPPRQIELQRPPATRTALPATSSFDVLMLSAHMVSSVLQLSYFSGALPSLEAVYAETVLLCAKWMAEMHTISFTPDLLLHHVVMLMAAAGAHAFPTAAFLVVHVQVRRGISSNAVRGLLRSPAGCRVEGGLCGAIVTCATGRARAAPSQPRAQAHR
eukprot:scaffold7741_cov114-Isochrysis_galbana.AAC.7